MQKRSAEFRVAIHTTSLFIVGAALTACGGGGDAGVTSDFAKAATLSATSSTPSEPSQKPAPSLPTPEALRASCAALKGQVVEGVTVTDTKRFEANQSTVPAGFCQVLGTRAPYLDMEVVLPDDWSGRYWQQGGGGFDGEIASGVTAIGTQVIALSPIISEKKAIYGASNGGNRKLNPLETSPVVWFNGTPEGKQSAVDYAYAALGTTMQFAKALAEKTFFKRPNYSYFNGCSNGGRNAYIAAERWPEEFDGIVTGCETMDMTGQAAAWLNVLKRPVTAQLNPVQMTAAHDAALGACDALDGVTDGIIANPGACKFNPAALTCGRLGAPLICLLPDQVETLQALMSDIRLSDGRVVFSGYFWSSELGIRLLYDLLGGGFGALATDDVTWLTPLRQVTYNADTMYDPFREGLMSLGADHNQAAVASFLSRSGKKMISWNGGNDGILSTKEHFRNWSNMTRSVRGDVSSRTRFFVVPGAGHGVGSQLSEVDWATAIVNWVENEQAPAQLTYSFKQGLTERTLPVCQYPKYPRYVGSGDVNASASYSCTSPN